MNFFSSIRTALLGRFSSLTKDQFRRDLLAGREVPKGVLIFRVFGAFFFGVVDKLDDEFKRAKMELQLDAARQEIATALERAQQILGESNRPGDDPAPRQS